MQIKSGDYVKVKNFHKQYNGKVLKVLTVDGRYVIVDTGQVSYQPTPLELLDIECELVEKKGKK